MPGWGSPKGRNGGRHTGAKPAKTAPGGHTGPKSKNGSGRSIDPNSEEGQRIAREAEAHFLDFA